MIIVMIMWKKFLL